MKSKVLLGTKGTLNQNKEAMESFRSRPKSNSIQNSKWQELYILTGHWKSDLLFYKDDLRFLRHLVDKYFVWIEDQANLDDVRRVGETILKATRECEELLGRVDAHLSHLANSTDNDSKRFRTEHGELEDELAEFIKRVRQHRVQLFKITEYVIDSEKLQGHLKD
ncbi:hypothetical protein [uncultured Kriegella sp.]|uniref:hypothetical protein n=1 Tax=uncultured Kriegella sp. TaxID=1798910 RepID=UPI0030DD7044